LGLPTDLRTPGPAPTPLRRTAGRQGLQQCGVPPGLPGTQRGTDHPHAKTRGVKGLGELRYVVEQTFALLHQFRRLAARWERRLDIHDGLASLACALICWGRLINWTR
jgi:hypothetical protein